MSQNGRQYRSHPVYDKRPFTDFVCRIYPVSMEYSESAQWPVKCIKTFQSNVLVLRWISSTCI